MLAIAPHSQDVVHVDLIILVVSPATENYAISVLKINVTHLER